MSELNWWVQLGDSAEILKTLPTASADALVTDPPAGIGFMGRDWDGDKGGKELPEGLGPWLAGFVDGEGNFDIHKQQRESGDYYYCRFEISLRADDGGILQMLRRVFGGKIYYGSPGEGLNEKARWELVSRAECARLVDLFDRFPLQSKKARDFSIWREALAVSVAHSGTSRPDLMEPYWQQLRATRPYSGKITTPSAWRAMQPNHRWIAWLASILAECRRVMKPGAYGWVWALPRTSHWTAMACEDAGFAVRDVLVHVFGTGFPKSRALLKPAAEHWILIKAPGDLQELRIDENRIGTEALSQHGRKQDSFGFCSPEPEGERKWSGRWPANFALSHDDACVPSGTRKVKTSDPRRADGTVNADLGSQGIYGGGNTPQGLDKPRYCDVDGTETVEAWQCAEGCPVKMLDEQSAERGMHSAGAAREYETTRDSEGSTSILSGTIVRKQARKGDSGGASRFFYVAKPSTKERSAGLPAGTRNVHTTVKSIALMEHLISLVAAPGQLVLDPFTGSGTTGIAALKQGCRFVGVEQSEEYCEIARRRILHYAGTIPAHELVADAAGVPGHDAAAHHADKILLFRDSTAISDLNRCENTDYFKEAETAHKAKQKQLTAGGDQ